MICKVCLQEFSAISKCPPLKYVRIPFSFIQHALMFPNSRIEKRFTNHNQMIY